jgi:glycosyltransferase involved in cell wall biosynthesis
VRVAFYTENYVVGGCDRFLVDLISNLDPSAFTTSLAGNVNPTFDAWLATRLPSHLPRLTIDVSTLPNSRLVRYGQPILVGGGDGTPEKRGPLRATAKIGGALLRYEQALANYIRLRRLFRRLRPDVLHINNGGYPGGETCRVAALAARREGVGAIVHFVHSTADPPAYPTRVERELDRRIAEATDLWVTAADRAGAALHERRHIPLDRIETVHYGIDMPSTVVVTNGGSSRERPIASVVASFDPGKGHAVLVDALDVLKGQGIRLTTQFIGVGPERASVERRVAESGLQEDVRFLGWRNDVDQLLADSDLLVLPSIAYECLPYSILEAMGHGLPVVATDLAGVPEEVIDGVTGRVVPPADANALAQAIRDVSATPERARAMGQKGKERLAANFSTERMVARMTDIYTRLVAA